MKAQQFISLLIGVGMIGIIAWNIWDTSLDSFQISFEQYTLTLQAKRKEKDIFFKNSEKSPIEDKTKFEKLTYFEPSLLFRIKATIEKISNPEQINLPTTQGKKERYYRSAWAVFKWQNQSFKVLLLQKKLDEQDYFLAFADQTNGKTTYSGGRYLDIRLQPNANETILDFNLAYHPYCVYNSAYICPIPPKENYLNIAVLAGEKL